MTIVERSKLQMITSLYSSIQEAGGCIKSLSWDKMENMTVNEFFDKLASNNIRFCYHLKEHAREYHDIPVRLNAGDKSLDKLLEVGENTPIMQTLSKLLVYAVRTNCQKIIIEPNDTFLKVYCDDILVNSFTRNYMLPVIERIKMMAGLKITVKNKIQFGEIMISIEGHPVTFKTRIGQTEYGEFAEMDLVREGEEC